MLNANLLTINSIAINYQIGFIELYRKLDYQLLDNRYSIELLIRMDLNPTKYNYSIPKHLPFPYLMKMSVITHTDSNFFNLH